MSEPIIQTSNLTKRFRLYPSPTARLAEWLTLGYVCRHTVFTALEDISFTVNKGEFFGIVGPNGSGKSTLLKLISRVLLPTSGSFSVVGRVTSLLELGTGFQPELTGRQNVINSGRLLGFSDEFVQSRMENIIAFSELEEHIDVPIKYYSSGMVVRLAFSMFAHVEPDVFIVDEALSVGDISFSQKCFARLDQMRDRGCTLLFVSHDLAAVRKYCDKAMFLDHGKCIYLGEAVATTDVYLEAMSLGGRARRLTPEATTGPSDKNAPAVLADAHKLWSRLPPNLGETFDELSFVTAATAAKARIGSGEVRVVAAKVCGSNGKHRARFGMHEPIHVQLLARVDAPAPKCTFSIQVSNRMGVIVWGTNHARLTGTINSLTPPAWAEARFVIEPGLGPDHYTIDVGFGDASGLGHVYDRLTGVATIEVASEGRVDFMGLARVPCRSELIVHPITQGAPVSVGQ